MLGSNLKPQVLKDCLKEGILLSCLWDLLGNHGRNPFIISGGWTWFLTAKEG